MAEISPEQHAELLTLLAAYCNDTISDAEGARLEEMLWASDFRDQAAAIYVDYVSLHWDLRKETLREQARESLHELSGLPLVTADAEWFIQEVPLEDDAAASDAAAEPVAAQPPAPVSLSAALSDYSFALAGLASALAVLLIVSILVSRSPRAPTPKLPSFAALKSIRDCAWAPTCRLATLRDPAKFEQGVDLAPGELIELTKGSAEITFATGAEMVIDAPARLVVATTLRCELQTGRVFVRAPRSAVGFTIALATMDVVDLGTEFGVEAFETGGSEIHVLTGKVDIKPGVKSDLWAAASIEPQRVEAGSAIRASAQGEVTAIASDPARFLPTPGPRHAGPALDLVDLICGGDGSGLRQGTAVDPGTGEFGVLTDRDRASDGVYHLMPTHRALDGCFLPRAKGSTVVDSGGHAFEFPLNAGGSGYLICAGGGIGRMQPDRVIPEILRPAVFAPSPHRMLLMHPNVGLTFDLSLIRRCAGGPIRGFNAVVLDPDVRGRTPKGDVYVLVDGASRFERRGFTVQDTPFTVQVALEETDRFLTLVTTDGGDTGVGDWITWGDAVLETEAP